MIKKLQFWKLDTNGNAKIKHSKMIDFLNSKGLMNLKLPKSQRLLVKKENNLISESSQSEVIEIVRDYLDANSNATVKEVFAKGVGSYINKTKLSMLKTEELLDDRDLKNTGHFYFKNCYFTINRNAITRNDLNSLKSVIWKSRVIDHEFKAPGNDHRGQFEEFIWLITKSDERFNALKSAIGYLLHRNKDRGEDKAIIFYDEKIGQLNQAHGGTGKTLLSQAIGRCREVESFDGKEIKKGSWFKNQRINMTTDVLVYDDLKRTTSLEDFYSMITSGIEVEKKGKASFYLEREKSPKIMMTSNYVVSGPGGSSDARRRYEFELRNHFSNHHRPEDEFGNRFFGANWSMDEENKFYYFMMSCLQYYLKHDLIEPKPINIGNNKLISGTCPEFVDFAKSHIKIDVKQDKRRLHAKFMNMYPHLSEMNPHQFDKWMKFYAESINCDFETKSSGGNLFCWTISRSKQVG